MAYVILTGAQARAVGDIAQERLQKEVDRVGAAMIPPVVLPRLGGIDALMQDPNVRLILDNGDDDAIAGPKTIAVVWRDATDPPRELWVLHLWGPSNRRLALGQFICQQVIAQFSNLWTLKWGVGLPYANQYVSITGATVTNGVARVNVNTALSGINTAIAGGQT